MNPTLKSRYSQVITHLHPKADDAYRALRAESERRIADTVVRGQPCNASVVCTLQTFPEVASSLAAGILKNESVMAEVTKIPEALLNVLTTEYDLAADSYEGYLVGEGQGEYIFRLLLWANRTGRHLRRPLAYYEDWLARDPYWAGLWMGRQPAAVELAAKTSHFAETARAEDPAAAYAWLAMHPEEKIAPYNDLILQNPFYTFLALTGLNRRLDTMILRRDILSPRWAYHLALVDSGISRSMLEEVLLSDMGWLVEYIVDGGFWANDPPRVSELYRQSITLAVQQSRPHACLRAFHSWVARLTNHHKLQREAAAAQAL